MTRTGTRPTPAAEDPEVRGADDARSEGPSATETVVTAATGMVLGGAALWFLAPICFVC